MPKKSLLNMTAPLPLSLCHELFVDGEKLTKLDQKKGAEKVVTFGLMIDH